MKDTSGHEKRQGPSVTNGMRQGDDTSSNPAHGEAMGNVRRSGTPGVNPKYMPNTRDMDGRDDHSAHDKDETFE